MAYFGVLAESRLRRTTKIREFHLLILLLGTVINLGISNLVYK